MSDRDGLREARERNLEELTALGLPYFPRKYGPTRPSLEIKDAFDSLEGSRTRVAGRLMRVRLMGKAAFAHIQDAEGQIQLYFKLDVLGQQKFEYFKRLDLGDIIGAEGKVFRTRTGEVSLEIEDVVLLAKAYLPLPEKFHGLTDVEMRYRQRYLDLITNEGSRRVFRMRSAVVTAIRRYLDERGFLEVETPVLQQLYGGAAAEPFMTHYAALETDVYLRIATELYLKRVIIGGFDRVYEIGKDFRNEGISWRHSPEFTQLELYQAYADYGGIMALTEDLVSQVGAAVMGSHKVRFNEHDIDLTPPWRRLTVADAVFEYSGIDLDSVATAEELTARAAEKAIEVPAGSARGQVIGELVSTLVESHLIQPTLLYDYPIDFPGSLLARRKPDRADLAERFEVYIGGLELGNAFTELNEPADQLERMRELAGAATNGHQAVDWDFVRALEHGMPPTGGLGLGIDRLVMLLAGVHHIRETILFPLLRPHEGAHVEP